MSIYSDKLAHIQVVINCQNIDAQMCTCGGGLAYILGALSIDVMSYNSLTTSIAPSRVLSALGWKMDAQTCVCFELNIVHALWRHDSLVL